jgi:hypothetical protein
VEMTDESENGFGDSRRDGSRLHDRRVAGADAGGPDLGVGSRGRLKSL